MSLRARLLLGSLYLLVVVIVALEIPFAISINGRAVKDFESGLLRNAALVAGRINDELPKAGTDPSVPPRPPPTIAATVAQTARVSKARFVVTDLYGRVLADSDGQAPVGTRFATPQRPEFRAVFAIPGGQIDIRQRFSTVEDEKLLLVTVPVVHNRKAIGAVRASALLSTVQARVHRIWIGLGLIALVVILGGLALSWFLATSMARPVRRLEDAAARLGRGDLDARAPEGGPTEVAALASSFNRMAGTLSANLGAQQDFLANASHQLRTPITGLKLRLEAIEHEGGDQAEQARKAQVEVDRLAGLVEDLLKIARASSTSRSSGGRLDLADVAREAGDRWTPAVEDAGSTIEVAAQEPAVVWADSDDLALAVDNLIENAVRYCPAGTAITLEAGRPHGDGRAILCVADSGPGIPPDERERVFDRFYRGSTGRRAGSGTGLGLAITAELVRRWDGAISLSSGPRAKGDVGEDGGARSERSGFVGTRFEISFPAVRARPTFPSPARNLDVPAPAVP